MMDRVVMCGPLGSLSYSSQDDWTASPAWPTKDPGTKHGAVIVKTSEGETRVHLDFLENVSYTIQEDALSPSTWDYQGDVVDLTAFPAADVAIVIATAYGRHIPRTTEFQPTLVLLLEHLRTPLRHIIDIESRIAAQRDLDPSAYTTDVRECIERHPKKFVALSHKLTQLKRPVYPESFDQVLAMSRRNKDVLMKMRHDDTTVKHLKECARNFGVARYTVLTKEELVDGVRKAAARAVASAVRTPQHHTRRQVFDQLLLTHVTGGRLKLFMDGEITNGHIVEPPFHESLEPMAQYMFADIGELPQKYYITSDSAQALKTLRRALFDLFFESA